MIVAPLLAVLTLLAPPTQQPASPCNNLSRTHQIGAGTTNVVSQNCTSVHFTVTIAGQSVQVTTPSSCNSSQTTHSNDVFSCGPTASGINCNAHGESVTVKVVVNENPCPTIPNSLPTTLEQVRGLMTCGVLAPEDPKKPVHSDWSASVANCTQGGGTAGHSDGEVISLPFDGYEVRLGDPTSLLSAPIPNAQLLQLEALQTGSLSDIPESLRNAMTAHPQVAGAGRITAVIQNTYFDSEGTALGTTTNAVEGKVAADGRFSLARSYISYGPEEEKTVVTEDLVFDGATFFIGTRGNSFYNAYASSSPYQKRQLAAECSDLQSLLDWVYSPFYFTRFPGTLYSVVPGSSGTQSIVTESYPQMNGDPTQAGHTVFTIDSSPVAHPSRVQFTDQTGAEQARFDYSDFRSFDTGVWRPFIVTQTRFRAGSSTSSVISKLTINTARPLTIATASDFQRPAMPVEQWFVRR